MIIEENQLKENRNISIEGNSYILKTQEFAEEIKVEHYLEEFIPNNNLINHFDSRIRKVEKIDPLKERISQDVVAFRYYDRIEVNIDGECFTTKRRNFSSKIYLGKRLTKEEIIEISLNNENILPIDLNILIESPSSFILCDNGTIITVVEDDAITISEIKSNKSFKKYKKSIGSK